MRTEVTHQKRRVQRTAPQSTRVKVLYDGKQKRVSEILLSLPSGAVQIDTVGAYSPSCYRCEKVFWLLGNLYNLLLPIGIVPTQYKGYYDVLTVEWLRLSSQIQRRDRDGISPYFPGARNTVIGTS